MATASEGAISEGAAAVTTDGTSATDGAAESAVEDTGQSDADQCSVPNSFAPTTAVLMANGTRMAIDKIRVGDRVLATNPKTGVSQPETVTAVEINHDHDLLDLELSTPTGTAIVQSTRASFVLGCHNQEVDSSGSASERR